MEVFLGRGIQSYGFISFSCYLSDLKNMFLFLHHRKIEPVFWASYFGMTKYGIEMYTFHPILVCVVNWLYSNSILDETWYLYQKNTVRYVNFVMNTKYHLVKKKKNASCRMKKKQHFFVSVSSFKYKSMGHGNKKDLRVMGTIKDYESWE